MADLDRLLEANRRHAEGAGAPLSTVVPADRLAIVTCMDVRIDPLAIFGLRLGGAHVIRNAGARVTEDVLRSLALSTHLMEVDTVLLVEHTGCGLFGVTDDELRRRTGAPLDFSPIDDYHAMLRQDVELLTNAYYLDLQTVAGLLYDVVTQRVEVVEERHRQ